MSFVFSLIIAAVVCNAICKVLFKKKSPYPNKQAIYEAYIDLIDLLDNNRYRAIMLSIKEEMELPIDTDDYNAKCDEAEIGRQKRFLGMNNRQMAAFWARPILLNKITDEFANYDPVNNNEDLAFMQDAFAVLSSLCYESAVVDKEKTAREEIRDIRRELFERYGEFPLN